jgi:hypothetical protein
VPSKLLDNEKNRENQLIYSINPEVQKLIQEINVKVFKANSITEQQRTPPKKKCRGKFEVNRGKFWGNSR